VTAVNDGQAITLTGEEAAFVRQALAACSQVLSAAQRLGSPGHQALAEAALQAGGRRPLGKVHYDISLAIDYLDFAAPARSTQ
jgi:hypothetical protein